MAYLTTILEPFNAENRETIEIGSGNSVYTYLKDLDYDIETYEPVIGKNQIIIEGDFIVEENDIIVFCLVPKGGGSARKVWQVVAMIIITVVSFGVGAAYGIAYGLAVGVAGSMAVTLLLPPQMPSYNNNGYDNIENSPTYGWGAGGNALTQGVSLPILYGTMKITPPVIVKYIQTVGDKQFLHVLYALCEGEIDGIEDIKVNNDPIEYFNGVSVEFKRGGNNQSAIPYFISMYSDKSVGRKVSFEDYITAQTDGNSVNYIAVNLLFSRGIYYANDNGGLSEINLYFNIEYKREEDSVWTPFQAANNGVYFTNDNTNEQIRRTIKATVAAGRYEVRVKFNSKPPSGSRYGSDCYFEFLTEGIADTFTYPNTALLGIRALATDQLSGNMPTVTCIAKRESLNNPAWACLDLLTNTRYGAGVSVDRIDYNAFASWADWCVQKNFTCNIYIDSSQNLRKTLDTISQLGRGVVIQYGSKFSCIVERPDILPAQGFLFGMGNIVKDSFKEEFLPLKDRANIIEITYYDKDLDYDRSVLEVAQGNFDITNEINKTSITLLGCTNREQALKHAKFLLNCNRYLTITATWEADIDSIHCKVGDIVNVAHDVPEWGVSGRIIEVTQSGVYLDRSVEFEPEKEYFLQISDPKTDAQLLLKVTNSPALKSSYVEFIDLPLTVIEPLSNYSFGTIERITKRMRVIKISTSGELRRTITAVEYITDVYNDSVDIDIPELPNPQEVKNLSVSENSELLQGGAKIYNLNLIWQGNDFFYNVWYKNANSDEWIFAGQTYDLRYKIENVTVGQTYDIAVGRSFASAASVQYTVLGDKNPPSGILNFYIDHIEANNYSLRWQHTKTSDTAGYEIRCVYGESNDWDSAQKIHEGLLVNSPYAVTINAGTVTFFIKVVNNAGIYSQNFARIVYNVSKSAIDNLIERIDFHTDWVGKKQNVDIENGRLVVSDTSNFWRSDELSFWRDDNDQFWRFAYVSGTYIGNFTILYGGLCWFEASHNTPVNVYYRRFVVEDNLFWGEDMSAEFWEDIDSHFWADNANVWIPFLSAFTAEEGEYQIKIELYAIDETRPEVETLSVFIDVPDLVESFNDVYIPVTGKTITPAKNFRLIKTVLITLQDDGGSAYVGKVIEKNPMPVIRLYDKEGEAANGTVDIQLRGY